MSARRIERIRSVLDRRQPDLSVVMESVHKAHNFSAILRTCDAVGVLRAHAIAPQGPLPRHNDTASGSHRWVQVQHHHSLREAITTLRDLGMQVLAAHRGPRAVDFRQADYTRPTAVLMGNELDGVSEHAVALADATVVIPMMGMVESLNVSVAAALILYEAQRQREAAGMYRHPRLPAQRYQRLLFEWAQPRLASWCRHHGRPYPPLDEEGDVAPRGGR